MTSVPPEVVAALGGREPTEQQWRAIGAPLEPSVLIAGAGSGKTAVMAARITWLIVNGHAKANEILGLTFTNKAAESLRGRVRKAIEPLGLPPGEEPVVATYHSFASSLIADYGLRAGYEPGAALLTDAQVWQLIVREYVARTYRHMEVRTLWHVGWIRHLADECANHLLDPDAVAEFDRSFIERIKDSTEVKAKARLMTASEKRIELCGVVSAYRAAKRARHVMDYGDQIAIAAELASDPGVAEDFRARFRFALLDEYQDTNVAQALLLKHLMPDGYPVMAVGDPDQNIYAWRGASLYNLLAFAGQFRKADGSEATTLPLEVNFRSGKTILDLANVLIEGVDEARRPPGKVLRHFPERGSGAVAVGLYSDEATEAEAIAGEAVAQHDAGTPWREIAVLCRKKRLFPAIVEAFRARAVPLEVTDLGGLLKMPEVTDLVSLLRVIDDPMRNIALARLLRGPRWRIGHRDLALIGRHAAERNRGLREQMGDNENTGDIAFSLAEELSALDEIEGVSAEARARVAEFNAMLARLRTRADLPLPELVARALDELGLLRELDASPSPAAHAAKRNLANFLDRIAAFRPLDGQPTLGSLMDWLDAVDEADEDMEASQPSEDDSVKLMTIHKAKGLEYDVVFVPGLARGDRSQIFPDISRRANPMISPQHVPVELRGDREVFPRFTGNLTQFTDELRERALEEERRLLYVAVTRARARLVCTAAHWYYPSGMDEQLTLPLGPSEFWREIRAFPEVSVLAESEPPEENPLVQRRAERAARWPAPARREPDGAFPEGLAAVVKAARAATAPDETLFPPPQPAATASARALSVTSVVTHAQCPRKFYWSTLRPLPRRSTAAARIGTIVHAWIEQEGKGQIPLVDPEEYERPRAQGDAGRVAALKEAFRTSRFFGRRPALAEQAFAVVVGDAVVHGRIDAIFDRADGGWEIVDWKSGRARASEGAEQWQLDLYALAAQEIWGRKAEELTVTFVYLGDGTERSAGARPAEEIRASLQGVLDAIGSGEFPATPSSACGHCDFLKDCREGSEFITSND